MSAARYGENIFVLASLVRRTLRLADWDRDSIEDVWSEIKNSKSYDEAVKVCARHITIKDLP